MKNNFITRIFFVQATYCLGIGKLKKMFGKI